jgi:mono/diheme cytochrome c family protein
MKRTSLFTLLLLPGLAAASGPGEAAFNTACARCHTVGAPAPKADKAALGNKAKGSKAPQARAEAGTRTNLVELMSQRTPAQVLTWIQAPHKVRRDTHCDTRLLAPEDTGALLSYVMLSVQPPAPSRQELLRQERQKDAAELRKLEQERQEQLRKLKAAPVAPAVNSTTQGKK